MAKCFTPYYRNLLPKSKITPLTERQLRMVAGLDPARKGKVVSALTKYLDQDSLDALTTFAGTAPQRWQALNKFGATMNEQEQFALDQLNKIREGMTPEMASDASEIAEQIFKTFKRGDVLSQGEREFLTWFANKAITERPIVMEQLRSALELGDKDLITLYANKFMEYAATMSVIAADKRAASITLNSYKRLNKVLKSGNGKIDRLFDNGAC